MKLRLWRRRLSISAPRMKVTTTMPWAARIVFAVVLLGLGALAGIWLQDSGRSLTGLPPCPSADQLAQANQKLEQLLQEREALLTSINTAESQLAMERAAGKQVGGQIKALEAENARLKEDLAFFEKLLPLNSRTGNLAIRGIAAELVSPVQLQYRLLVMQGGKGATQFEGTLRLTLTVVQNGRPVQLHFPDGKSSEINNFRLSFRHYQRLEGIVSLPPGAQPQTLQATELEKGQVRAQQSLNL